MLRLVFSSCVFAFSAANHRLYLSLLQPQSSAWPCPLWCAVVDGFVPLFSFCIRTPLRVGMFSFCTRCPCTFPTRLSYPTHHPQCNSTGSRKPPSRATFPPSLKSGVYTPTTPRTSVCLYLLPVGEPRLRSRPPYSWLAVCIQKHRLVLHGSWMALTWIAGGFSVCALSPRIARARAVGCTLHLCPWRCLLLLLLLLLPHTNKRRGRGSLLSCRPSMPTTPPPAWLLLPRRCRSLET